MKSDYLIPSPVHVFTVESPAVRQWLQSLNVPFGQPILVQFWDVDDPTNTKQAAK